MLVSNKNACRYIQLLVRISLYGRLKALIDGKQIQRGRQCGEFFYSVEGLRKAIIGVDSVPLEIVQFIAGIICAV